MSATKPIGLCLIGAGAIAERHMQAFARLGGVMPRWVISRNAEAARDFARRWSFVESGAAVAPALADPLVELALICSPSPLHSQQALAAMQAGKDVIVEIPIALNWPESQQVAQVAATLGRRVWVCHTMRSTAALREVRRQIRGGELHVTQIAGFFGIPRRRNQGMGSVGTRNWIDNLLWHHGCHQVDAALWVLDMPAVGQVRALFGPNHPTLGMALDVAVQMSVAGGKLITQALTYNTEQAIWRMQFNWCRKRLWPTCWCKTASCSMHFEMARRANLTSRRCSPRWSVSVGHKRRPRRLGHERIADRARVSADFVQPAARPVAGTPGVRGFHHTLSSQRRARTFGVRTGSRDRRRRGDDRQHGTLHRVDPDESCGLARHLADRRRHRQH
jgi:2-hydroxy-4-carboxymuconate semialdehyde hemiacetal dehydrogenase